MSHNNITIYLRYTFEFANIIFSRNLSIFREILPFQHGNASAFWSLASMLKSDYFRLMGKKYASQKLHKNKGIVNITAKDIREFLS